jgi:hypothetical protein
MIVAPWASQRRETGLAADVGCAIRRSTVYIYYCTYSIDAIISTIYGRVARFGRVTRPKGAGRPRSRFFCETWEPRRPILPFSDVTDTFLSASYVSASGSALLNT